MKTLDLQIKRKPLDIWVQLKQRWSPDEENDFTLPALKRAGRLIRQQFGYRDVLIPPQLRETKWTMHCYVKTRQLLQGCQARCLQNKCDRSPVVYWKAATKFLTHINLRHKPASTQRIQRRADSNRVSANRRWRLTNAKTQLRCGIETVVKWRHHLVATHSFVPVDGEGGVLWLFLGGGGVLIEVFIRRALRSGWENKSHQAISQLLFKTNSLFTYFRSSTAQTYATCYIAEWHIRPAVSFLLEASSLKLWFHATNTASGQPHSLKIAHARFACLFLSFENT